MQQSEEDVYLDVALWLSKVPYRHIRLWLFRVVARCRRLLGLIELEAKLRLTRRKRKLSDADDLNF
jgi:hypothetical protein